MIREPIRIDISGNHDIGDIKMTQSQQNPQSDPGQFEKNANSPSTGMVGEFLHFLTHNKKWWLFPIIVILLLMGVLVVLGGTAAGPFIYTLF
jgi:hypothetical protein